MRTIEVRIEADETELLDASEELRALIEDDGAAAPPLRALLQAIDDAITGAFVEEVRV